MNAPPSANAIDAMMERASQALASTEYFRAAELCLGALDLARRADDFGRMARICLPLQEARRWVRQEALDTGTVAVIARAEDLGDRPGPGCYLVQPPLIGVDARQIRQRAWAERIPVFVLCREPMTRDGQWPIVGVGERVARVRIDPPPGVVRWAEGDPGPRPMAGDRVTEAIHPDWFAAAGEALGDRAIVEAQASAEPGDPPGWLVDDFLDYLEACPEHEKFLQALAQAGRDAIGTTTPRDQRRRRGVGADPFGF
ncbi:MAG: hypothetical protein LAT64_10495 [Phycisphaerales bacterium]|nr:hypothetical protein [Planctomycetota bacterium]MCH8509180.1 hypothetical protein [Phycisphaerales bacterium]